MSMAAVDRVRIRELLHAYNRAATVRAADLKAEEVLANGRDAAHALQTQVSRVLAEEADDPPHRVARDRAAEALRTGAAAALRRYRALVAVQATDPVTGSVLDQGLVDHAESLMDTYLPDGNLGGLAQDGPALQIQARLISDALATRPLGAPLAANVVKLHHDHGQALERVAREADELAAARKALEAARAEADKWRRAGFLYASFLQVATAIPVDLRSIYPVEARKRSGDPTAADQALTEAGAEALEDDRSG